MLLLWLKTHFQAIVQANERWSQNGEIANGSDPWNHSAYDRKRLARILCEQIRDLQRILS